MADRPNILVVMTDQQSGDALGCAGDTGFHTPHADRLAAEGARFRRAYCTQPLCTPSRGSMFTGLMPRQCGTPDNACSIRPDLLPSGLGNLLRAAGYDCGYAGKWHVPHYRIDDAHGFECLLGHDDRRLPQAARAFIERERDRPFCLVASFDNPHNICEWARSQELPWGPVDEAPLEDCPNLPVNLSPPPFGPEILRTAPPTLHTVMHYPPEHWRRYRHAYRRLVERADAGVGEILAALDACGRRDDTIVVFLSDHGDMQGAHGLNQKWVLYEESIRVPLILRWPGRIAPGTVRDDLASTGLDLLPTLCAAAGCAVPPHCRGIDLLSDERREAVVVETRMKVPAATPNPNVEGRCLIRGPWKYSCYDRGLHREQLADLATDPGEMVNLAIERRHAPLLQEMRDALRRWCEETGDGFVRSVPGSRALALAADRL